MIPSDIPLLGCPAPDPSPLTESGWIDEAQQARTRVVEILRGWLETETIEREAFPTPAELEPLVVVGESGTPAAEEAELLLALLAAARWVAGRRREKGELDIEPISQNFDDPGPSFDSA